jgi:hypothetical protein
VQRLVASKHYGAGPQQGEQRARRIIGCGVILFHVLILIVLVRMSPQWNSTEIASLVLLNLSAVPAVPKSTSRPGAQQRLKPSVDAGNGERKLQSDAAAGHDSSQFDQTPQADLTAPLTDWSAELDTVAKADAPELLAERRQKCHEAEIHGELLVGCGKAKTPDIWDHHRGLAEFFAIGKRQANGHLFDDMNDPDRERSSVPDIVALQRVPHHPMPLAIDPSRDYYTH